MKVIKIENREAKSAQIKLCMKHFTKVLRRDLKDVRDLMCLIKLSEVSIL